MSENDGWDYSQNVTGYDGRKLVTLEEDGMIWIGIRAWSGSRWLNNGEPERAKVIAWRNLPPIARGYWERGELHIPKATGERP